MKDNKINLNEYKVNYPNSEKIYKQIEELKFHTEQSQYLMVMVETNSSMYMILLVLIQIQVII